MAMNARDLPLRRLRSHRITSTTFDRPGQVVAWFGAMQAQDYPHARWAVGLRCAIATDADVERAIADRSIVRTWAMRGTLQLIAAQDVRSVLRLVGPRIIARGAANDLRRFGLDAAEFARVETALDRILRGVRLTRKDIYAALEKRGIATDGQRGYHILARAGLSGQICFGEWRGKEETFTLLDEWLPRTEDLPRDQALAELARRYFRSHGPATLHDFVWWSSLTVAEARAGLEGAKRHLIQDSAGGVTYWLPDEAVPAKSGSPGVHLLPGFDEYLLGYADRNPVLAKLHNASVIHSNGIFKPTVVVDGQIVGTWGRVAKKDAVVITPTLFSTLSNAETHSLGAATQRYGAFIDRSTILAVATKKRRGA
jgi:hypothetical protein